MKKTIIKLGPVAFAFLVIVGCNSEPKLEKTTMPAADLIAAANELDSLFLVAFNSGDADALMKLYWNSPDLLAYTPAEMEIKGYPAVKESFRKDFASNKGAKLEYTDANNIPFADAVVGHGTFKITIPVEGSSPMEFHGRYSEVKAFKDGKMVIVLDHASVPMAPPTETAPTDTTKDQ